MDSLVYKVCSYILMYLDEPQFKFPSICHFDALFAFSRGPASTDYYNYGFEPPQSLLDIVTRSDSDR
jgi:hypothetical protein